MNNKHKNRENIFLELLNLRTLGAAALVILGLTFSIWAIAKLWPLLILAAASVGALYVYRRLKSGISVGDDVSVTREALSGYIEKIIYEIQGVENPVLTIRGNNDNLHIKINMDFPSDPSNAADFHANIIYLQGYLARRLYDDFRISGARVEIAAASHVEEPAHTRPF